MSAKFDVFVRDDVSPFLAAHGFKRRDTTFHRFVAGNWEVVQLERSRWSDSRRVEFAVNLAVGLSALRERQYQWPDGSRPPASGCQLRERLGVLLWGRDLRWEVRRRTDIAALAGTVNGALEGHALPWLRARSTDAGFVGLVGSDDALRAEPMPHLYWFERLAAQRGDHELCDAVVSERRRREAQLRRRLVPSPAI